MINKNYLIWYFWFIFLDNKYDPHNFVIKLSEHLSLHDSEEMYSGYSKEADWEAYFSNSREM